MKRRRGGSRQVIGLLAGVVVSVLASAATADNLFVTDNFPALASDRAAQKVGDSLTVLIQEESQASDTTQNVGNSGAGLSGSYSTGSDNGAAQLGLSGNYTATGQHRRSGQMIAQISVVVDNVLPNGDLHVTGDQLININGQKTQIHLAGRVRRADISSANTVFSTSLADANIVYGGPGANDKRGFFGRLFSRSSP